MGIMIINLKICDTPYSFTFQIGKVLPISKLEPTHREIRCLVLATYISYTVAWGKPSPVPFDPAEENVKYAQDAEGDEGVDMKTTNVGGKGTDDVKVEMAEEGKGSEVGMPFEPTRQGGMTVFQQTAGRVRSGADVRILRIEPGGVMIIVMILLLLYLFLL